MNKEKESSSQWYVKQTLVAFLLVLFAMPLAHAAMILMEKLMSEGSVHVAGFLLGLLGFVLVVIGVFARGDTRQTLWGLFGGLLFWTGWVEFLFMYYARRYGVQPEIEHGVVVTQPEYLILPASFGMWMMTMVMYVFSTKNGCLFITWVQLYNMDSAQMFRQKTTHHLCTTHDTPHLNRNLHGNQHDAVGFLSLVDVLLRQKLLW